MIYREGQIVLYTHPKFKIKEHLVIDKLLGAGVIATSRTGITWAVFYENIVPDKKRYAKLF